MPRFAAFFLAFLLCVSNVSLSAQTTPIDVLYVVTDTEIQTYNVDPGTGYPISVGRPLIVGNLFNPVPSANDRFLYLMGFDNANNEHLWVYATNAKGVPKTPPLQDIAVSNLVAFEIAPNGMLAYVVQSYGNPQEQTVANISVFLRNPKNGLLSTTPQIVATYPPNGPCGTGWSVSGGLLLPGFSRDGTKFYDEWYCTAHDTYPDGIYFKRQYNQQTGALGPEKEFFGAFDNTAWFTSKNITYYDNPIGSEPEIFIYPPTGGTQPVIQCTAQMLQACGYAIGAVADPAGEYVFLQVQPDYAGVEKIDMGAKKIVDTGNFIPDGLWKITPDRKLLYSLAPYQYNPYILDVYLFDATSGGVQGGGVLSINAPFFELIPAIRQ